MGETGVEAPSQIELPKVETAGLLKTRQLIGRYQALFALDRKTDENQVDIILKKYGLGVKTLVPDTITSAYSSPKSETVVRTDATSVLFDKLKKHGADKLNFDSMYSTEKQSVSEEIKKYETQSASQQVEEDLEELENILQIQQYINGAVNKTAWAPGYRNLQQKIDETAGIYRANALKSLIKRTDELFAEDVLGEDVPYLKDGIADDKRAGALELIDTIKNISIRDKAPQELRNDYLTLVTPLEREFEHQRYKRARGYFENSGAEAYVKFLHNDSDDLSRAIKAVSVRLGSGDNWDNVIVPADQTRKIYDSISPVLLGTLFEGGRESWDGTYAAGIFLNLRDPRVLPSLIEHLRRFGSGHTSNIVAHTINEITKNPLEKEDLEKVLAQTSLFNQMIIRKWFLDSNSPAYQMIHGELGGREFDGYSVASMMQQGEQYLVKGELVDIALDVAKSKGETISNDALRAYFYDNDYMNEPEGRSTVDSILLQNLDKVAVIVARSKLTDWRLSSPKIFNALVNPDNGEISRFPKIIASEGLGLEVEWLDKIDKLYQSGDLRRGAMSRVNFAEGLLFLSSKEDGPTITKNILIVSTGANRDSERIRDIFSLLRTLDSFGKFEFTPKENLGEIIVDLKNKLVSAVVEKMELGSAETPVLYGRLTELSRSGVFEIIPPLLARFHEQGKEDVARVVREVGRHIVLGDFRQWRNSTETAITQLGVLPEDKRDLWLHPAAEISFKIGVTKEDEIRKGAVDAIRRIASEARAHILEVYKLDFSASGINVLNQRRNDLTQSLKDETKDVQERKDLGIEKRGVDDQLRVIEGLLGLENLDINNLDPVLLNKHVAGIINSLNSFQGLEQAASDLTQINEVLTTQAELGNVTVLKAYDSDDPMSLLKVGIEPRETCQSYRNGSYNHCLPAYVADANKRVINVENDKGEVLGRSVMKLTHIKDGNGQMHPAILLEPIYATSEIAPIYRGIAKIALEKAKAAGAYLIIANEFMVHTGESNERLLPVVETEAKKEGRQYNIEDAEVYIPRSLNSYEYSDSLGGVISYFDTYHNLQKAVVVRP